jgi:peptidoglycan-N-acetylglucosamine deacetylase
MYTQQTFWKLKGKNQMKRFFAIPGVAFLLSLLWYARVQRRLLQQEREGLRARERFLYAGNTDLPEIALTFDDGPNPLYTPQVLAILRQYGIKATFFCIGRCVAAYPDLVEQAHAAGHVIANHSWSHPYMALLSRRGIVSQLTHTSEAIVQAIGVRPIFFRPPFGAFSSKVLKQADRLGMRTVIWNVRATDWMKPGVDVIAARILERSTRGGIILLHDGGGDRSETVAALPAIIEGLQQRGFAFVTLQQMTDDLGPVSQNGGGRRDQRWSDILMQLKLNLSWKD